MIANSQFIADSLFKRQRFRVLSHYPVLVEPLINCLPIIILRENQCLQDCNYVTGNKVATTLNFNELKTKTSQECGRHHVTTRGQ